jgi:hypothetical protein
LAEPLASQPPAASASRDEPAGTIRISGSIRRADVANVCARAAGGLAPGGPSTVDCDVGGVIDPGLPVVEVLARLAALGQRHRHRIRLEHASPAILDLLVLCGLEDLLGGDRPPRPASAPAGPSGGQVRR